MDIFSEIESQKIRGLVDHRIEHQLDLVGHECQICGDKEIDIENLTKFDVAFHQKRSMQESLDVLILCDKCLDTEIKIICEKLPRVPTNQPYLVPDHDYVTSKLDSSDFLWNLL